MQQEGVSQPIRISQDKQVQDEEIVPIPRQRKIHAPFTSQAPFANWDPPFDEACEEAALLMVHHALEGTTELTKEDATGELLAMIAWQTKHGYSVDVSTSELAEIAREYYGLTPTIYEDEDVNPENIKKILLDGHPIIVPTAGQLLGNRYFSGDGPPYHMLVITGVDEDHFIVNDPGTRRGKDYKYTHAVLMNAIHDWIGSVDTIEQGPKKMLILQK